MIKPVEVSAEMFAALPEWLQRQIIRQMAVVECKWAAEKVAEKWLQLPEKVK